MLRKHKDICWNNVWWITRYCSNLDSQFFIVSSNYVRCVLCCKWFGQVGIKWKNGVGHYLILSNQLHDILSSIYFRAPSPIIIFNNSVWCKCFFERYRRWRLDVIVIWSYQQPPSGHLWKKLSAPGCE